MPRLVVNPGSPAAWEVQLKPGENFLGRSEANDFQLPDPSVSGSHCQITVSDGAVVVRDLGSTNGTFVNRAPIHEAALQTGQTLQIGQVELLFCGDGSLAAPPRTGPPPLPTPVLPKPRSSAAPQGLVLSAGADVNIEQDPALWQAPPPLPAAAVSEADVPLSGNCKHHPRSAGRHYCPQCRKFYCDLCVNSRPTGAVQQKFCRHCGSACVKAHVQPLRPVAPQSFYKRMPSAFLYPFRGTGLLMLIVSTVVLSVIQMAMFGWFSILLVIAAFGYLFSYMQNIIHATANEEEQMPELPGFDDVFGGAFRLAVTTLASFGLPIALALIAFFSEAEIPAVAIIATTVLGCLYFPMAFLAVAMKDSALAANPLVVVPAILRVPLGYLLTAIVVVGVYAVREVGDVVTSAVSRASFHTRDMSTMFSSFGLRAVWALISVYLLVVSMRILGLLYVTNKQKFGWFQR
ncbi:MAG TPA: FHA domain-containing protein [Verrucomicrobiae bacterium]|nr:FHA domain-containing protein [Verrucomicrobiae bacterium]